MGAFSDIAIDLDESQEHNDTEWRIARKKYGHSKTSGSGIRPKGVVMTGLTKAKLRNRLMVRIQNWSQA